jgi:hypothetical protein
MKKLSALILGAALCAGAQATTVTYDFTKTPELTDINQTGQLSYFDATLGTLTAVDLTLSSGETMALTLSNNATTAKTAGATAFTFMSFTSSLAALDAVISPTTLDLVTDTGGSVSIAGNGGSHTWSPLTANGQLDYNLDSILASFIGTGSFGVSCTSDSAILISGGGGNVSSSQVTNAFCGASITYTYDVAPPTPTPEPASLALVGLGLVGVAASRRKSRQA